jgi:virginiamycin A acetyltransferase
MLAATTFIMNSGYHLTESVYSFPFVILGDDWSQVMDAKSYPINGNAVVGNGA